MNGSGHGAASVRDPIAIVGRGAVLPGALSPDELWRAVVQGRDLLKPVPDEAWPLPPEWVARPDALGRRASGHVPFRGGFVEGFEEVFDASSFGLPAEEVLALDRSIQWLIHAARQAVEETGRSDLKGERAAAVIGNLSYPTRKMTDLAYAATVGQDLSGSRPIAPRQWLDRFVSGRPAHVLAQCLDVDGPAFCLDAACASSLYAVKLACDYLRDGTADVVFAGAVNGCDNIFLHRGFAEIGALSPTARSRPFSRQADGLLPAEGAAVLLLKRLDDAICDGDSIHAVIRGIGLSNDGRCRGLLMPDSGGQLRAIEAAYRETDLDPSMLSLMECHATGTLGGDRTEVESVTRAVGGIQDLPVGSLKSNLGHLITVAGIAAIIKVAGAMREGVRPVTLNAEDPIPEFENSPLRPLLQNENWPDGAPRLAGINNFGFGGNNAHLVLEAFDQDRAQPRVPVVSEPPARGPTATPPRRDPDDDIVVCGIGVIHGDDRGLEAFARKLAGQAGASGEDWTQVAELPLAGLAFPPNDLKQCLGQQTLALEAALQAMIDIALPEAERCGVIIGMGTDVDAARPGLVWRAEHALRGRSVREGAIQAVREDIGGLTGSAYVMGSMPNLPANRINVQLDMRGLGFTVSSEELSGLTAAAIAVGALQRNELDLVLAGGVDLSSEALHRRACAALPEIGPRRHGDGAIVLALKRRSDAERYGDPIIATIEVGAMRRGERSEPGPLTAGGFGRQLGQVHAASALFELTAGLVAAVEGPAQDTADNPCPRNDRALEITTQSFTGWCQSARLRSFDVQPADVRIPQAPLLTFAAADTAAELAEALRDGRQSTKGGMRIAITAGSAEQHARRLKRAIEELEAGRAPRGPGIAFGSGDFKGEVAFVFPGLGSAYPGVLRQSLAAFPEVRDRLDRVHGRELFERAVKLIENWDDGAITLAQSAMLGGGVSNFNTALARTLLGLRANACLGVSMGEISMMFSHGLWGSPGAVMDGLDSAGFYTKLGGDFPLIAKYFGLADGEKANWQNFDVFGSVERLREEVNRTEHVWILIITSGNRCLIGGDAAACAALISRLPESFRAVPQPMSFAFHGPFSRGFSTVFHRLMLQPIAERSSDVRYYFNAENRSAELEPDTIAKTITCQGKTIDFPATVLQAWQDGVRAFIELGPRSELASSIQNILHDRPHVTVSLDLPRRDDLSQLADACAKLFAYGLTISIAGLARRLDRLRGLVPKAEGRTIAFPAHLPEIRLRDGAVGDRRPVQIMREAPALPTSADVIPLEIHLQSAQANASGSMVPSTETAERQRADGEGAVVSGVAMARPMVPALMPAPPAIPLPARPTRLARGGRALLPVGGRASTVQSPTPPVASAPIERLEPSGPTLDRAALELASHDRISEVFGEMFKRQDSYRRQCRLPKPPLLLVDRITGIQGEPGSMGKGVCWTETDVRADSWYLDEGRMPTGIVIESGQADLLLISWLGADFLNCDERVYRLLGCEITFHEGELPKAGDTISYQIHIDAHANVGNTRLFFFRYDARIGDRLLTSVRHGQAGFFSDAELANSDGVLWSPEDDVPKEDARLDPGPQVTAKRNFSSADVRAFAEGHAYACFGEGFEVAASHQRTPKIPEGRMQLIDRVTAFDPTGGPWGRGYLRAEFHAPMDCWFYDGHFHNDPCMPGTLMAEAAVQALEFYVAAQGFTIGRDGWRFQPATGEPFKFECRGQVIPDQPHQVTYEIFVEEVIDGDRPTVYAALLAKSDGFKVFMCRRFGVTLVPDWPLYGCWKPAEQQDEARIVSPQGDVRGDHAALMACAWGKPSDAFGSMYRDIDAAWQPPRLPAPPYHFVSRILSVDCLPGQETAGGKLVSEYDVPPDAWYFADGGTGAMPFSVLIEVALQPCGWLASYMGYALGKTVKFRNLDGQDCIVHGEVGPETGTITVEVTFIKSAQAGPMIIVFYEVVCRVGNRPIITLKTDFGFFPPEALANQKGLTATDAMRAALEPPQDAVPADLGAAVLREAQAPLVPTGRLDLVDEVAGFWPDGGEAGLGRALGRQRIDPSAWYFKAHFFTDPVQPGSLGLEALFTLLKAAAKLKGLQTRFAAPRFESPALGQPLVWAYRGQAVPTNTEVRTEIDIVEIIDEGESCLVRAKGSLWVDGLRIYEVTDYCLRIRESNGLCDRADETSTQVVRIDLEAQPWLKDHKPTFVVPAYPLLGIAGLMLSGAGNASDAAPVTRLEMLEVRGWLLLGAGPLDLEFRSTAVPDGRVRVSFHRLRDSLSEKLPTGRAITSRGVYQPAPTAWLPLEDGDVETDPYGAGGLFHDGAFQLVEQMTWTPDSSMFSFEAARAWEAADGHPTILLDGLIHGFPHYQPERWFGASAANQAAFPYRLEHFTLHEELPRIGRLIVLTRRLDAPTPRTLRFAVQAQIEGRVVASAVMVEALVPTALHNRLKPLDRRGYCQRRVPVPDFGLSTRSLGRTSLAVDTLQTANWLPGTFETIYDVPEEVRGDPRATVEQIAIKDHIAAEYGIHPADVCVEGDCIRSRGHSPIALSALSREWVTASRFEVSDIDGADRSPGR